jgi:phosphatidylserine/phosphatidylglycerophosphate/cardiolipin synthase-like enzyme
MEMTGGRASLLHDVELWQQAQLGSLAFQPDRVPILRVASVIDATEIVAAVSPDSSYRMVKAAIDAAIERIDLYIYNLSADHLVALLQGALDRHVAVRIMYDTHDTRGDEAAKLQALVGAERRTAPSSGRRRVFTVCHQKFAVIDGKTVLLGSANWAASSIPLLEQVGGFRKGNREWLLAIRSDGLADWFGRLFQADWDIPELPTPDAIGLPELLDRPSVMVPMSLAHVPDEVFDLRQFQVRAPIDVLPIISPQNYLETVLALIEGATESIAIQQQYILDGGGATRKILAALAARTADLEIRAIASPAFRKIGASDSWELTVASFQAHGLKDSLRAMNLRFYTHCHNKGVIVDRRKVVVSSTNWSDNSIERAREAGVVIDSQNIAGYFATVFDSDWSNAWDAADVPANLVEIVAEAEIAGESQMEIHPADLV